MTDKACRECHYVSDGSICPNCEGSNMSDDFSGVVIIIDPECSAIARAMKVKKAGHYALRVRQVTNIRLSIELREELKKPQGLLIEGPSEDAMKQLKAIIKKDSPSRVISVGDIVSQHMLDFGLPLDVLIVDNKTMRKAINPIVVDVDQTLYAKNPSGTITEDAWNVIRDAIGYEGRTKVMIDGEEDLLTVVAVLSAPEDALVVYGQPNVGIVAVKVTEERKENMRRIVDLMKQSSKS